MIGAYFRNAGILGVTELLLRFKTLFLLPILTRALGPTDFGAWAQVAVIVGMVAPIAVVGTDSAAVRFLPGTDRRTIQSGVTTLILYYAAVSVLFSLILVAFAAPIATVLFGNADHARFVVLCGAALATTLLLTACRNYYRLVSSGRGYATLNVSQSLIATAVSVVAVTLGGDAYTLLVAGLIADFALIIAALGQIALSHGFGAPDTTMLVQFMRFGLPLVPMGYGMWALNSSDRIFLAQYGTLFDIGVYSVAYNIGYALIGVIFNPIWVMYPSSAAEMYNHNRIKDLQQLFRYSTSAALALLIPAMAGLWIYSRDLLSVLTTPEFVYGADFAVLITLGYGAMMMASYFDVSLGLVGRQSLSTLSMALAAILHLVLNFLFIPSMGIGGAALSTFISFAFQYCLTWWFGSRALPLTYEYSRIWRICAATAIMIVFLVFVYPLDVLTVADLALASIAGVATYVIGLLALRTITPQEMRAIRGVLANRIPADSLREVVVRSSAEDHATATTRASEVSTPGSDPLDAYRDPEIARWLRRATVDESRSLEIGCGMAQYRAAVRGTYVGIDITDESYRDLLPRDPDLLGDAHTLPFVGGSFDVVFLIGTLHQLTLDRCLSEARRVLRPGGSLLVFDYSRPTLTRLRQTYERTGQGTSAVLSGPEWLARLREAGFVRVEVRDLDESRLGRAIRLLPERLYCGWIDRRERRLLLTGSRMS